MMIFCVSKLGYTVSKKKQLILEYIDHYKDIYTYNLVFLYSIDHTQERKKKSEIFKTLIHD